MNGAIEPSLAEIVVTIGYEAQFKLNDFGDLSDSKNKILKFNNTFYLISRMRDRYIERHRIIKFQSNNLYCIPEFHGSIGCDFASTSEYETCHFMYKKTKILN